MRDQLKKKIKEQEDARADIEKQRDMLKQEILQASARATPHALQPRVNCDTLLCVTLCCSLSARLRSSGGRLRLTARPLRRWGGREICCRITCVRRRVQRLSRCDV